MSQFDRYKNRTVDIDFITAEDLIHLPYAGRFTLVFLTNGSIKELLNGHPIEIGAPGFLFVTESDSISITEKCNIAAQSFSFHADFLNSTRVTEKPDTLPANLRIQTGMALFDRDYLPAGVLTVPHKAYLQLYEWFFILGTEVAAQSDELWVCRIKKYLIQILGMLENLNRQIEPSAVDLAREYIITNYFNKLSVNDISRYACLNRVSLNNLFKEKYGCTAMGYLMRYRLQVAGDLLIHTDMSLNEIAHATGFEYDTYFIRQFIAKRGMSPTSYRNISREHAQSLGKED